ncbi:MAG: DUF507 family protein, partial [Myxococcota bacterium]|nr:DUF507 family protein [Myxococcota bacterium]
MTLAGAGESRVDNHDSPVLLGRRFNAGRPTVRIYRERIPTIARGIVEALMAADLIEFEASAREEVELDCASVLQEYRRTDWELTEKARDLVSMQGLDYSHTHKIKSRLAADKKFSIGENAIEWLVEQTLEILLQSHHVE